MPDLQTWATSPREITKDDNLAFESPVLQAAAETWFVLAEGQIPPRSRFTARTVKGFVGHLIIFEKLTAENYLIRLMGTRVTNILGEMQGKTLTEALPAETAGRWCAALNDLLAARRPMRLVTTLNFNDLHYLEAEIFLAPLTDDAGKETKALAAVVFRQGLSKKTSVADLIGKS